MANLNSSRIAVGAAVVVIFVVALQFHARWQEKTEQLASAHKAVDTALTIDRDAGRALRECVDALKVHPDDAELLSLQGQCYHALKRYSDAVAAFERARSAAPAELTSIDFFQARSLLRRFLDTGDRGDLNLAEIRLDGVAGSRFEDAGKVLLGLAYARDSDVQDRARARDLLRVLEHGGDIDGLDDLAGAKRVASELGQ